VELNDQIKLISLNIYQSSTINKYKVWKKIKYSYNSRLLQYCVTWLVFGDTMQCLAVLVQVSPFPELPLILGEEVIAYNCACICVKFIQFCPSSNSVWFLVTLVIKSPACKTFHTFITFIITNVTRKLVLILIDSKGFRQWCIAHRTIGILNFFHYPVL
jgi:hypothetical protein